MPVVSHVTQEEPRATLLRLSARGEPCEYEREAAEIVVIAEAMVTSEMVALPTEVGASTKWPGCETSDRGLWSWQGQRESGWKSAETPASTPNTMKIDSTTGQHTWNATRGGVGSVCERQHDKELRWGHESNALVDVQIMIPERADGSSKSKKTEDTTAVESNSEEKQRRRLRLPLTRTNDSSSINGYCDATTRGLNLLTVICMLCCHGALGVR